MSVHVVINVLGAPGDAKMCKVCDRPLGVHTLEKRDSDASTTTEEEIHDM